MKDVTRFVLLMALFNFVLAGCEGFFGEKTDLDFIETPDYDNTTDAYIPVLPALDGFQDPSDVLAGFDELVYVADVGAEEIVAFDQAGNELGRLSIPGVKRIAQDRKLHLIAIGTADTTLSRDGQETTYTVDAIYRINPYEGLVFNLNNARIVNRVLHPYYYTSFAERDTLVRLTDVAALPNNQYYVTRTGPVRSRVIGGPDDAVLLFNEQDEWIEVVSVSTSQGRINDYFRQPVSIATLAQPTPSGNRFVDRENETRDFVVGIGAPSQEIKTQYMSVTLGDNGFEYRLNLELNQIDTSKADGFLYTTNKFALPAGVDYALGSTEYIFAVDAQKDSLYQFGGANGFEGIDPPPTADSRKWINVSFGGSGGGPMQFSRPSAVAEFGGVVYVCDRGNKRVSRFRLASDFNQ